MLPRRFALVRHVDYTGVSGIGVVAYGVQFGDGHVEFMLMPSEKPDEQYKWHDPLALAN